MPHADSSLIPCDITTKAAFYDYVAVQLEALLGGQRNWISNLSNAAALLYHSFLSFPSYFGASDRAVNWSGFYLEASMFPNSISEMNKTQGLLLLGPFSGKPACQFIRVEVGKGVCADAFVSQKTIIVENVEAYPGHIACDGETKSEIVLPIMVNGNAVGVLDLDCLALGGFNEEDQKSLENIVRIIVKSCDWPA